MPSANSETSPRKLLTMKPAIELRILGIEHRLGADQARDHAAAVDVADQHHRHVGGAGKAHIGDVVGAQIDLRRAARAFDQDEVGSRLQRAKLSST